MLWTRAVLALWLLILQGCSGLAQALRYEVDSFAVGLPEPVAIGPRFPRLKPKPPSPRPTPTPPAPKPSPATAPPTPAKNPPQATQHGASSRTSFEERKKLLGSDPKRGYLEHEGQVGAEIERKYGGFKRDLSGDGEWVSLSGPYKGKTFDLLGIPPGKSQFHSPKMEKFLPSVDSHFRKSIDHIVLDTRNMTAEQKKTVLNYIDAKWKP